MITIPDCGQDDVEIILKAEPFREWLRDVHSAIVEIVRHMISPRGGDDRTIERVQQVSMHIWRHANKVKIKTNGQLMNATWSEEFFTMHIPLAHESFGTIRIEKPGLHVHLAFPHPVEFMCSLGFSKLKGKRVQHVGIDMTLQQVAFLVWCEHMKPGLSAPFLDMVQDGEL